MVGSKYSDEDRIKAKQMFASEMTVKEVSKTLNIPEGTLRDWKNALEEDESFKALRERKSKEYIGVADRIVEKSSIVMETYLDKCIRDKICGDIGKVVQMHGIVVDKRALALGDNTVNVGGSAIKEVINVLNGDKY